MTPARMIVLFLTLCASSHAAEWIALDQLPPGTPPTVAFDPQASDANVSWFDVTVHGFFKETLVEEGEVFERIWLPGGGHLEDPGRPSMPHIPLLLGIPTDAPSAFLQQVDIMGTFEFPGMRVFPSQTHIEDTPDEPPIVPFDFDQQFYGSPDPYPLLLAEMTDQAGYWKRVHVQAGAVFPIQFIPIQNKVVVHSQMRVGIGHAGVLLPPVEMTRRSWLFFEGALANPAALQPGIIVNWQSYDGCFLFLTHTDFVDAIQPLVRQKRARGYKTTVLTNDDIGGSSCSAMQSAIGDWYEDCADKGDAYVLVVGDSDRMGVCQEPYFGLPSDLILGSIDLDIYSECGVGRLSVDSELDCEEQVAKILAYEDDPPALPIYDEILLVGYQDQQLTGGKDEFEEALNEVASQTYAYSLNFTKRYGKYSDGTVANVLNDINAGKSIVCYDGHGSSLAWKKWDFTRTSLVADHVRNLTNSPVTPVVLALCCQNSRMDDVNDCIGEVWLEDDENRAVAHYAALRNAYRCHNHLFASAFFRALYGDDSPTMADVCQRAQFDAYLRNVDNSNNSAAVDSHSTKTIWQAQLLGDPEMVIWQESPTPIFVVGPLDTLPVGPHDLGYQAVDEFGDPVPGAILALHKEGELQMNAYTDSQGWAFFSIDPQDPGEMTVTLWNDIDSSLGEQKTVWFEGSTSVDPQPGYEARLVFHAEPSVVRDGRVRFQLSGFAQPQPVEVGIYDVTGRRQDSFVVIVDGDAHFAWEAPTSGAGMASGIYFATARSRTLHHLLRTRFILEK